MLIKRLPVIILTGFLGSGKTTLLRYLLTNSDKRLAVIVNEFGSVGLDGDLLKTCDFCPEDQIENRIVELKNGCLCCTVQDDFLPTMEELISRSQELDGIIVETSGLALPRPLLQAIQWPEIRSKVFVNGVVTMVDGEALSKGSPVGDMDSFNEQRRNDDVIDHITPINELFNDQLNAADLVLISRSDILSPKALKNIKHQLSLSVQDSTNILPLSFGKIDPSVILGLDRFNPESSDVVTESADHHDHDHVNVISETLRLDIDINQKILEEKLIKAIPKFKILRVKGRCWLKNKAIPLQVQMVGSRFSCWFEGVPDGVWKPKTTGIDLVILSLEEGAAKEISSSFCSY